MDLYSYSCATASRTMPKNKGSYLCLSSLEVHGLLLLSWCAAISFLWVDEPTVEFSMTASCRHVRPPGMYEETLWEGV